MRTLAALFLLALLLSACVPQNQYNATVTELNYYRAQAQKADSLEASQAVSTYNTSGAADVELSRRIQQVESLTATNRSLNRSFEDIRARYDELLAQNQSLLSSSGEQISQLQQNLADRVAQVSQQEAALREKEIALQAREQQLSQVGLDNTAQSPAIYSQVSSPVAYESSAKSLSAAQQQALKHNQLQNELVQSLLAYPRNEVSISPTNEGDLMLRLSEKSLFSNSFTLTNEGRTLLQRIAQVLQAHPNAQLEVVGHSDAAVDAVAAFEQGTDRAILVAQNLISHGIRPQYILAASQGYYVPVAGNTTDADRAANRRTEIRITLP